MWGEGEGERMREGERERERGGERERGEEGKRERDRETWRRGESEAARKQNTATKSEICGTGEGRRQKVWGRCGQTEGKGRDGVRGDSDTYSIGL